MSGCCCNRTDDVDEDVGVQTCCGPTPKGARCVCLPYNDCLPITAQIISIVALIISWFWWITFIVSIIAMILLQIIWCCRQNRAGMMVSVAISGVTAALCLFSGIYFLVRWRDVRDCTVFFWFIREDDDYFIDRDYCPETAWAMVAFADTAMWLVVSGCLLYFVVSGRYAKWDAALNGSQSREPAAPPTAADVDLDVELPVMAHAVLASDPSYLPPETMQKTDNAAV